MAGDKEEEIILALEAVLLKKEEDKLRAEIAKKESAPTVTVREEPVAPQVAVVAEDIDIAPTVAVVTEDQANPIKQDPIGQTFIPAFSEQLRRPDLERLTGQDITGYAPFYESEISYQDYLQLRQAQIKEFADMSTWYANKERELKKIAQEQGLTAQQIAAQVAAELKKSFIRRYRDMFYLHQTKGKKFADPNTAGVNISTFTHRLGNSEAFSGKFFDYDFRPWKHDDRDAQALQLYALMRLFAGVCMQINGNNFELVLEGSGQKTVLLTGKNINSNLAISCQHNVLSNPSTCDRALCLMVDQRKRLMTRTYGRHDDSFPINGSAKAATMVRLYQLALVQNLNPMLEKKCLDAILASDQANGTYYSHILAHLMLIKEQAGKALTPVEQDFRNTQLGKTNLLQSAQELEQSAHTDGVTTRVRFRDKDCYLGRRLQKMVITDMHAKIAARYATQLMDIKDGPSSSLSCKTSASK